MCADHDLYTGTVRWFGQEGFGFITRDDTNKSIFVHKSGIEQNHPTKRLHSLRKGESVEFEITETDKGLQATAVTGPDGAPVKGSRRRYTRRNQTQQNNRQQPNSAGRHTEQTAETVVTATDMEKYLDTLPQFGEVVPVPWRSFMKECTTSTERMFPTEWVGYKRDDGTVVFAQVAYSIWSCPEDEISNVRPPIKYRIYLGEDDYVGKEVKNSLLFKFTSIPAQGGERLATSSSTSSILAQGDERLVASSSATVMVASGSVAGSSKESAPAYGERVAAKTKHEPDVKNGWRYFRQARIDLEVAKTVSDIKAPKFGYIVCFLSQQVAEKALVGLVLARHGKFRHKTWHGLEERVKQSEVEEEIRKKLSGHVACLENYYLPTRYPDKCPNCDIPADCYTKEDAKAAQTDAGQVLCTVEECMPTEQ